LGGALAAGVIGFVVAEIVVPSASSVGPTGGVDASLLAVVVPVVPLLAQGVTAVDVRLAVDILLNFVFVIFAVFLVADVVVAINEVVPWLFGVISLPVIVLGDFGGEGVDEDDCTMV
jgi:hypothetical protein